MVDLPIYLNFTFAFLATVGFAVYFSAPKVSLIPSGIIGGLGWLLYIFLFKWNDNAVISTFFAAGFVAFLGEVLARKLKNPATVFTIPGILPLAPGVGIYNTMLYMVQKEFELGFSKGVDTLSISAAIALGILVVTSITNTYNILNRRRLLKKLELIHGPFNINKKDS
ncbi:threonine/serine exporter [Romboutsia ilealis]|uniref:Threonine/serine exporter family protein n=1 Tax=Romboutsia faecis TaxID=2764597 RepID=A0ABR7JRR9_9FIRM|nr:threonine/serine exporter family protein [Romboutsia faecis]MBC5997599.1 threonine/serine exporter family protein [Romboutsia faecis]MRN24768.1 threonine/serine exporter [Romboutsia ilealis]